MGSFEKRKAETNNPLKEITDLGGTVIEMPNQGSPSENIKMSFRKLIEQHPYEHMGLIFDIDGVLKDYNPLHLGRISNDVEKIVTNLEKPFSLIGFATNQHLENWLLSRALGGIVAKIIDWSNYKRSQTFPELMEKVSPIITCSAQSCFLFPTNYAKRKYDKEHPIDEEIKLRLEDNQRIVFIADRQSDAQWFIEMIQAHKENSYKFTFVKLPSPFYDRVFPEAISKLIP
jgi:hypothetical protein